MNKKFSIKGSFQISGQEEKEFEFEYENLQENEENNKQLFHLLEQPWRLILEGGKFGVNGVKRFFTVLFLFAISNTLLFFYSLYRLFSSGFEFGKVSFVFLVFVLGIGITIYATYRAYHYVIIDTLRVVYGNLSSLFQRLSEIIIDKAQSLFQGKTNISEDQLSKTLDYKNLVNSSFKKVPNFLRKGMVLVLYKIPLVGMLLGLKEEILNGDKAKASSALYNKMDGFITESVFGNNNTNWVWWLLPLNIIVQLMLIHAKIG